MLPATILFQNHAAASGLVAGNGPRWLPSAACNLLGGLLPAWTGHQHRRPSSRPRDFPCRCFLTQMDAGKVSAQSTMCAEDLHSGYCAEGLGLRRLRSAVFTKESSKHLHICLVADQLKSVINKPRFHVLP